MKDKDLPIEGYNEATENLSKLSMMLGSMFTNIIDQHLTRANSKIISFSEKASLKKENLQDMLKRSEV